MRGKVLVIGGPTATGKSDLAVDIAGMFDGEVVNADSVQIYKGMDIGTAKPSVEVRGLCPHHLFDVATLDDPWDVKRYEERAREVIDGILARGRLPVVVGGSGFYIRGLLRGVPEGVPSDPRLREELMKKSKEELYDMLKRLDPERARKLHPNDVKRVVRALEIVIKTGKPSSQFLWSGPERWNTLKIALDRDPEELRERIYTRVDRMIKAGWLGEVEGLVERYGADNRVLRETLGYRELVMFMEGRISFEEAVKTIKRETYRYSKKQRRWFRSEGFIFMHPENRREILDKIEEWLNDPDNGRRG